MSKIKLLSSETINLIAAGEVVGRPFSVVKELVENALDAGATQIRVDLAHGGKSLIRVTDNGCGMDVSDAKMAFVRHATSKISEAHDLEKLSTMGFRGEALPSIAAVSKLTLQTCLTGNHEGIETIYEGGTLVSEKALPLSSGTMISISDLFYNVPARQKYLKADRTEYLYTLKYIYGLCLLYPNIKLQFFHDQKKVLGTTGLGNPDESLAEVFSAQVSPSMLALSFDNGRVKIEGAITPPSNARTDREKQWIFVNQRMIQSELIQKAFRQALYSLFSPQHYPAYWLHIHIPSQSVDVNVHPSKMEVKFEDEQEVYRAVVQAIRGAFEGGLSAILHPEDQQQNIPSFSTNNSPVETYQRSDKVLLEPSQLIKLRDSDRSVPPSGWNMDQFFGAGMKADSTTVEQPSLEMFKHILSPNSVESASRAQTSEAKCPTSEFGEIMQIDNTYLLFWYEKRLWIIDQHIAQERVLFEKLKKRELSTMSQELLLPETLFLDEFEEERMNAITLHLKEMGFTAEIFGQGTWIVRSVPVFFAEKNIKTLFKELLCEAFDITGNGLHEQVYMRIACHASVKAGDFLHPSERLQLVKDWVCSDNNMSCPHGRPIAKQLTLAEIEQWFMRR